MIIFSCSYLQHTTHYTCELLIFSHTHAKVIFLHVGAPFKCVLCLFLLTIPSTKKVETLVTSINWNCNHELHLLHVSTFLILKSTLLVPHAFHIY